MNNADLSSRELYSQPFPRYIPLQGAQTTATSPPYSLFHPAVVMAAATYIDRVKARARIHTAARSSGFVLSPVQADRLHDPSAQRVCVCCIREGVRSYTTHEIIPAARRRQTPTESSRARFVRMLSHSAV